MSAVSKEGSFRSTLAATSPGGAARQFRVQIFSSDEPGWRMYATFSQEENAEQCLDDLHHHGYLARLVKYRLPAAA